MTKPAIFIVHPSDLLTDHQLYGDGLIAWGFIRELARRGYRLHVACQDVDIREPLPNNIMLHRIEGAKAPVSGRLRYMVAARRILNRIRRSERIDVVHQMNPVFIGLSLGMIGCGLPLLLGTYVARWPDARASPLASAIRTTVSFLQQWQADALMLTTPAALDRVPAPRLARDKIVPMNHGIDASLFSPRDAPPAEGWKSILFYTSVDRRKGIFDLLQAFDRVIQIEPETKLAIVGRGNDWDEVKAWIEGKPYRAQVTMHGYLPRDQAPQVIRDHAIYALPSHGEPLGTTAMEAMGCARPLVVSNTGGLPYLLPEGGGFKVDLNDPAAMPEALLKLLRSPELQRQMGRINREKVERDYAWERVVDRLEQIYAKLMAGQPMVTAIG